ncbi:MAG: phage tail protein [Chloroflexi bacterium CFX7]|nr:phage tail protein [Chloroflexi bacterium CFX7]MCK6564042.1 phage tail protein [Dehalococcoidia bacterium]RIL03308.1 MAG: phage tail protein [bacterium]
MTTEEPGSGVDRMAGVASESGARGRMQPVRQGGGPIVAAPPPAGPPLAAAGTGQPDGFEPPPGVPRYRSSYLDHLPGIYSEDDFLGRFLLIFESILGPVERTVGNLHHYFDPDLTTESVLDWLGSWLGLVLDERWPEERRRALVAAAGELYRWRGTRRGLAHYIRLYTGVEPEISEPSRAEVSAARNRAYTFTVRLRLPRGATIDQEVVEAIIDAEKPAFAAATLEVVNG